MSEDIIRFELPEDRKKFEVKMRPMKGGGVEKAIFIDNELLDWSIDMNSYVEACQMGPQYRRAVQQDIERHFIESVSDAIGRHVTMEDIKEAIKTGWI